MRAARRSPWLDMHMAVRSLALWLPFAHCALVPPPSQLIPPSPQPTGLRKLTSRRVLLLTPIITMASSAAAFDLPSVSVPALPSIAAPSLPSFGGGSDEPSAEELAEAESKAAAKVEKKELMKKIRKERMAQEAQNQADEYRRVQAGVGTKSFGSTVL